MAGMLVIFCCVLARAQDAPKRQMMMVHEDEVKPYMSDQYEKAVKDLNAKIKEHGIDFTHYTLSRGDFTYIHVVPMENHAQLDGDMFGGLNEKLGEKAGDLWSQFDGCYDSHKSFVVYLEPEYSFQPEGVDNTGKNWRRWIFWRPLAGKEAEVKEILKGWVDLSKNKGITQAYNTFSGGFGTDEPLYVFVWSGENAATYFAEDAKGSAAMGEEGDAQWQKMKAITLQVWEKTGMYREDLTYIPETATAGN